MSIFNNLINHYFSIKKCFETILNKIKNCDKRKMLFHIFMSINYLLNHLKIFDYEYLFRIPKERRTNKKFSATMKNKCIFIDYEEI